MAEIEALELNVYTLVNGDDVSYEVTADRFPDRVAFDPYLLEHANTDLLTVDGEIVTITVKNGSATYYLCHAEADPVTGVIPANLSSSSLEAL